MNYFTIAGRKFRYRSRLVRVCELDAAWYEPVNDPEAFVALLKTSKPRMHVFTFFQRVPHAVAMYSYPEKPYSVAVIQTENYDDWWNNRIGKKSRYMIRKAQKSGVEVRRVNFDDQLVHGIAAIYHETPVRQGKGFGHYSDTFEKIKRESGTFLERSEFLGAFLREELIGVAKIVFEEDFADILQLLSKTRYWSKGVTNALLAKIVEVCAERNLKYIAYGDWNSTSLGDFKRHNGFTRMDLPRYYVALNRVGTILLKLGLQDGPVSLIPAQFMPALRRLRRTWYAIRAHVSRAEREN